MISQLEKIKKKVDFNVKIEVIDIDCGHKILNYINTQTKHEYNNALNESIIEKNNNLDIGDIDLYYKKNINLKIFHKLTNYQSKKNILRFI
jgi:hypothetical protein